MDELFGPLAPFDALFLALERASTPMHLGAVGLIEPGILRGEDGRVDLDRIRRHVNGRFAGIPKMHRRVASGPLPFVRPRWVLDRAFDVERHVGLVTVPPPGDLDAFYRAVGTLMERPLDVERPLWELWVLDGLADGRIGILEKLHHALADGLAGVGTAAVLLDVDPAVAGVDSGADSDSGAEEGAEEGGGADAVGGTEGPGGADEGRSGIGSQHRRGMVVTVGNRVATAAAAAATAAAATAAATAVPLVDAAIGRLRAVSRDARGAVEVALHPQMAMARAEEVLANDVPALVRRGMNDAIGLAGLLAPKPTGSGVFRARNSGKRRVSLVSRPLEEVHKVARMHGATVNGAVLAAVSVGVGDVAGARGLDVTGRRAFTLVPVGYGHESEHELGNNVAALRVALPLGPLDPLERLDQVVDAVDAARRAHQTDGVDALLSALGPLMPWGGPAVASVIHHQPFVDLVVTNMPGPPVPLYLLGSKLSELVPLMPLAGNLPLGVAVLSYVDELNLGIIADPEAVPDLDIFVSGIHSYLDELVELH